MANRNRLYNDDFECADDIEGFEFGDKIDTGRGDGILFSADNLLDQEIMEAVADLIESKNNVQLLRRFQEMQHEYF